MINRITIPQGVFGWRSLLRRPLVQATAPADDHIPNERFHPAFQRAYRRFAQEHPQWLATGLDAAALRGVILPLLAQSAASCAGELILPTGQAVAWVWVRRFAPLWTPAEQVQQAAQLTPIAHCFLLYLAQELAH